MTDYASLCFLSFNRPEFIGEAVRSAVHNAGYPCEVIVHDDGSQSEVYASLLGMLQTDLISRLILNPPGHNEGVGTAFNRCAALSSGDPIIKLDQDMLFEPGWLDTTVRILNVDPAIAGLGFFKYPVAPCRWQDMEIPWNDGDGPAGPISYHYVTDFVSSGIAIPRDTWNDLGPWPEHSTAFAEDVEWKTRARSLGLQMALPDEDVARNRGFGYGPSTVCIQPGVVQSIKQQPVVFG